jgi:phosphoglycolate phosphatase
VKFKAVIFDLDGTLLDTLEDLAVTANEVLRRMGATEHPLEAYKTLVGDGVAVLFQRAWPATVGEPALLQSAVDAFQEIYASQWNKRSKPYDGIESLLSCLVDRQLPLAVLSNKPDRFTRQCVDHFLGKFPFSSVHGQKAGVPRKPDPAGVFVIARELSLRTEEIAYVGDTNTDMETAVSAGCCAIGVSWGFRAVEELQRCGAQKIVHTPGELAELLLA